MSHLKKRVIVISISGVAVLTAVFIIINSYSPVQYKSGDFNSYLIQETYSAKESGKAMPVTGDVTVSETNNLQLIYNIEKKSIAVKNKITNTAWSSSAQNSGSALAESEEPLAKGLNQLCTIAYTDFGDINDYDHTSADGVTVTPVLIEGGIKLSIHYTLQEISFDLLLLLDDSGLSAFIPSESVNEGKLALVSIDLFPMFGAALESDEGYILFPEGSGALYSFDNHLAQFPSPEYLPVYSSLEYDLKNYQDSGDLNSKNALLPMFGIVKNQSGFAGYICEGDENSVLTLSPSRYIYDLNRVYPTIHYRKTYSYISPDGTEIFSIEDKIRSRDFAVRYFFSNEQNSDYNDLSLLIRDYLIKSGRLNKVKNKDISVNLQILMGTMKKDLLGDTFTSLTTYEEAKAMLEELSRSGVDYISAILFGWQQQGYGTRPSMLSYASALGGKKGLENFSSWANDNKVEYYYNLDPVWADGKGKGYSKTRDATQDIMKTAYSNKDANLFMLNPFRQLMKTEKALKELKSSGVSGVAFDSIGSLIYEDYNKKSPVTRTDTKGAWAAAVQKSAEMLGGVAVQTGNAYTLAKAARIYDVPDGESHNAVFSETVPLYQLIVGGSVPFTSGIAGNMAHDFTAQKLKWLETGSEPWFIVTDKDSSNLRDTKVDKLFSSRFSDYKDLIIETYKEFKTLRQGLADVKIAKHQIINQDVRKVTYENGTGIYVNYGSESYQSGDIKVEPQSYLVVR